MRFFSTATVVILLLGSPALAAEPTSTVAVGAVCPVTGPGVLVCGGIAVVGHEVTKLLNGEDAFGPNGEVMKLVNVPVKNVEAANLESGEIAKLVRATIGISVKDIEKHGLLGGSNSFFRKNLGIRW